MVRLYITYLYLSRLFIPAKIYFSIWKPTSVKDSIATVHCSKCCGKGGIFFFCPQNKAMLMFTHRCLCLREFYSRKDHCYNGCPSTEFKFSVGWTQVCDFQLGLSSPLYGMGAGASQGLGSPMGVPCVTGERGWLLCHPPSPPGSTREDPWLPAGLRPGTGSPEHSQPLPWSPPPLPSGSCETSPLLEEAEERTQLNSNWLEYFSRDCHFQAALEPFFLSWWRSESWKIPSVGNIAVTGHCSSFLCSEKCPYSQVSPKELFPNGLPEQQG